MKTTSVGIPLLVLLEFMAVALAAQFTKVGCFLKSLIEGSLLYKDDFMYQSSGHCESQCSDKAVAALLDGKYCYCGSLAPDSSDKVDDSNCNVGCQGYDKEKCGGSDYFLVYSNDDVSSQLSSSSSSSASRTLSSSRSSSLSLLKSSLSLSSSSLSSTQSSSSSQSSTSSSSRQSSTTSSTLSSSSSSSLSSLPASSSNQMKTLISTVTASPTKGETGSAVPIRTTVITAAPASSSAASGHDDDKDDKKHQSKSLSGGSIAGIVVGSVAGVGLAAAGFIFLYCYRKRNSEDNDDEFTLSAPNERGSLNDIHHPNPFVITNGAPNQHQDRSLGTNLYSLETSVPDDYFRNSYAAPATMQHTDRPSNEYGRRRLSDSSLPDMAASNPLKVVNN